MTLGIAAWLGAALVLAGCASTSSREAAVESRSFGLRDLAKSDIDLVAEVHLEQTLADLRELMLKLYRRNPGEWKRTGKPSAEAVVADTFDKGFHWYFPELGGKRGIESVELAFDESYAGDRVLAFIAGVTSMVLASYNYKTEFYFFDRLDPQKLYNSARNVEIAVWRLANVYDGRGKLFLLSNSLPGEPRNLSYERLFGKIIANQDTMARIVADRTQRSIKGVIQRTVGAVFLPI